MSVTSIEIKTESRQRTLRVRIAIAIAVVLTGSFLALEHVSYGWVFVGLGSVAIAALWTRIRYVSMSARIEMKPDRISFINMFWCTFLDVRYSDIHLVERREVRGFGLARIARAGRLPLTIASSAMSSIADFRGFIRELETKTTPGTVVDRSVHQPTAAIVSFSLIALIVTIHVLVWRQGSGLQVMSLLAHGAFSPVLVSDGEWFRFITNAGLHSGWPHLLVNVMLIAFAFGELEERLGHSRILILMVVGRLSSFLF